MKNTLSFGTLREANIARLPDKSYISCENEWHTADWMVATMGELGEAANLIKKVRRGDFSLDQARQKIGYELADTVTYLDILAYKLKIDLGMAVRVKFNIVSDRGTSDVYIGKNHTIITEAEYYRQENYLGEYK